MAILLPEEGPVCTWLSLTDFCSLCLMGLAETPGCATLLPASLFVSNHQGTAESSPLSLTKAWVLCLPGGLVETWVPEAGRPRFSTWGGVGSTVGGFPKSAPDHCILELAVFYKPYEVISAARAKCT